jgi:hypothetical protein
MYTAALGVILALLLIEFFTQPLVDILVWLKYAALVGGAVVLIVLVGSVNMNGDKWAAVVIGVSWYVIYRIRKAL